MSATAIAAGAVVVFIISLFICASFANEDE
jgi:hypothetical protein